MLRVILKLGQIVGVLLMAAGVASCSVAHQDVSPLFFLSGGVVYTASRVIAWLIAKD